MIAAVIALAAVAVVFACVVGALVMSQGRERREWAVERRSLVDRAISRHAGETIALDRAANHVEREKQPPVLIEGLS